MAFLARETLHFVDPKLWLPNRLDLNPDYKVLGHMQQKICHTPDTLKQRLIDMWSGMQ